MLGPTITATFLLLLMVLSIIIGIFVFIYAATRFLAVVQETAAGADVVNWPTDPLMDKLPRAAYMAGLLAICIAPAGFFLKLRPNVAVGGSPLLTSFIAAVVILWALFPIGLLSALSASSPWIVFRPTVLQFCLRRFGTTLTFYAASALLAVSGLGPVYLAVARNSSLLTVIAPFFMAAAFLIYGRLLGRMAFSFDQLPLRKRRASGAGAGHQQADSKGLRNAPKRAKKRRAARAEDPWEVPEASPKKSKGTVERVKGYAIAADESNPGATAQPQEKRPKMVKGYRIADEPLAARPTEVPEDGYLPVGYEPVAPQKDAGDEVAPAPEDPGMISDFERRYHRTAEEAPPPAYPLFSGVYSFPFYATSVIAWVVLSLGGIAILSLIQICLTLKEDLERYSLG